MKPNTLNKLFNNIHTLAEEKQRLRRAASAIFATVFFKLPYLQYRSEDIFNDSSITLANRETKEQHSLYTRRLKNSCCEL